MYLEYKKFKMQPHPKLDMGKKKRAHKGSLLGDKIRFRVFQNLQINTIYKIMCAFFSFFASISKLHITCNYILAIPKLEVILLLLLTLIILPLLCFDHIGFKIHRNRLGL